MHLMGNCGALRMSTYPPSASSCAGRIAPPKLQTTPPSPTSADFPTSSDRDKNDNSPLGKMINAFLVFNGQGQPRLTKFYTQLVSYARCCMHNQPKPWRLTSTHSPNRKRVSSND